MLGLGLEVEADVRPLGVQFREAVDRIQAIKSGYEARGASVPTQEEATAINAAVKRATELRSQIEQDNVIKSLQDFGNQSQGSIVAGNFAGEAVIPDEGNIKGVTLDVRTGEYHVNDTAGVPPEYKSLGAAKLKLLRSGEYKDAYASYIKSRGLYGDMWSRNMKANHMKVLSEATDTAGGFWVPPDIRTELVKKEATIAGVSNDVRTFTVGSDLVTFPKVTYTTDDLYVAGVLPSWSVSAPASDASEATNPIAGSVEINVYLLTAVVLIQRSLLEDAVFDVLGFITEILGENLPLFKNNAYINGSGVGQPAGIATHPNFTVANASGGMQVLSGVANAMGWGTEAGLDSSTQGILGTEASLPPQYENGAKWYGKKQTYANIRGLVDGVGRSLWASYDGYAPYVNGYPGTMIGYPIVKDQFLDAIGDGKHPLLFGQMKGYYAPQRVGMSVEVFREVKGLQDKVAIYCRQRVGGKLVEDYRLKALKSDNA